MPEPIDTLFRTLIFVVVLLLLTKMIGKKQISQLTFFEYIAGITIGSLASEVILKLEKHIWNGLIAIIIFGTITWLADFISLKSRKARHFIQGKSTVFIKDGKVLEDNLKKEKYNLDDLLALLREKDAFSLADVEFAQLEHNGKLSVLLKKENQPLTPKDLNIKVPNENEPSTVIMDGKILDQDLARAGKTRKWLELELEKLNVLPDNVVLGQVNAYGELTVDIYDDQLKVPTPQERPLLLAMIKKCQADLELFSLETEVKSAQEMFHKNAVKLEKIKARLTPFLS